MKTLAILASTAVLVSAGPALACLPPLPVSASEQAEALWERQDLAWSQAGTIAEMRIAEVYSVSEFRPGQAPDPRGPRLVVRFEPVRPIRGERSEGVTFDYPAGQCGTVGFAGPNEIGTPYLLYSRGPSIAEPSDVFEIIPVDWLTHGDTLAGMRAD